MLKWTRDDNLNLLLFALLIALFYWRILTPNLADRQSFPPGDFRDQFWAFTTYEVRELSAGRLPLWNPYTYSGAPFWADVQSAVFYPPSLLTLILSAPWGFSLFALEIEAILHFWLGATFMYLFMRHLTQQRPAAFISALTFTFSGYLTGYPSQQLAVLESVIWLPLMLYFIHRSASQPVSVQPSASQRVSVQPSASQQSATTSHFSPLTSHLSPFTSHFSFLISHFSLLTSISWAMCLLAGHPQSAFIVAIISLAYTLFLTSHFSPPASHLPPLTSHLSPLTSHLSLLISHLSSLILGTALAAIQFIPAIEYTLLSVRASGVYDTMSGGFPLIDLVQFLLPNLVSHYSPLYIGVTGLILALTIPFTRHEQPHQIRFWAVMAAVTLLISFGGNTFLYSPLYLAAPGFSIFRGQERWAFATTFSLCVLVGLAYQSVSSQRVSGQQNSGQSVSGQLVREKLLNTVKYLLGLALLLVSMAFYGLNDTGWKPENPFYGLLSAATFLTLILTLTWLLWRFSADLPTWLHPVLTAAIICFDLFTVNWQTNLYPQLPEWHTQTPAIVQAIQREHDEQPFRVYNEFRVYDNYGVPYALQDLWGASPLRPARYAEFMAPPMPIERTWELLNVKYIITWRKELFVPSTIIYEEAAPDGTTYLHQLNTVGPRAWLVYQSEIADDNTILRRIADPTFDRWQVGLFEDDVTIRPHRFSKPVRSEISQIEYPTPQNIVIKVNTDQPAWLILSEPYYPGWQATVNGQPAPIVRADYILRAIAIPNGESTVTLTFRPMSFMVGALISLVTWLGVVGRLLYNARK